MACVVLLASACLSVVTAVSTAGLAAAATQYQDWPMFLQNPARTAATTDPKLSSSNTPNLKLKFAAKTGGPIATSTSIVGTTAYVGSWDGYEYAINTSTGAIIWKRFLGTTAAPACKPANIGITSSAAVVNGTLYVGGGDAYWYALDPATGNILWKVFTGDNSAAGGHYNWSSPIIYNGYAYIGVASNCDIPLVQGHLMKVAISGTQPGQVVADYNFVPTGQVGGGIWTSPTMDAATNTVFVSTGTLSDYTQTQSQAIVALDATTMAYKGSWQLPFQAAVDDSDWGTTPSLTTDSKGNQLLSVANKNGILYTFNRNNLTAGPVWQRPIAIGGDCPTCGDGSIASGIFANGVLYYAGGHNMVNGHGSSGSISAMDPGTGNVLWTRQTEQPVLGSPAYVNGLIGLAEGSTFEVLNASTGALLYSYKLPATVYSAVSVARSQFYVGAVDGNLYAFGLGTTTAPPPDANCPSGFACRDIGNPPVSGSEIGANGVLTITGSGPALQGPSDQFRFIAKSVTGDSQSSVQILSQSPPNQPSQAGLMARQSTDPTAPFYAVLADNLAQPDLVITYRSAFATNSIQVTRQSPVNKPISIMIQRTGNLFSTGFSTDGVNFQLIPGTTVDLDLPAKILNGIVVDSGSSTTTGTASFTKLLVGQRLSTIMTPAPPAHPCPSGWSCADVGNPSPPGDTTTSATNAFTLNGAGTGITMGNTDSFHYTYQQVSGDQQLSAQVVTQAGAPKAAQDGIMMRASASPTAPYYAVWVNPGGSATVTWRAYDNVPNRTGHLALPSVAAPTYLEVVRYEDTTLNPPQTFFSTLTSTDGTTWTPVLGSTAAINMGTGSYLAGMAATAGAGGVNPPVVYNTVSISTPASPPPGICPSTFSCADVGTMAVPGDQIYLTPQNSTPQWNILGGGYDIWSNYDFFRFAYQSFPADPANSMNGDGTVNARVVSQLNPGGPWMKSGVMLRSGPGTDPQAPYYGVFVTPQHGVTVQWRPAEAAQTNSVLAASPTTTPVWVLASRYTDTSHGLVYYTAYTSTDGIKFAAVPGSTVALNLPGPLVAGIASDSYSGGRSTAVVDNFTSLSRSQPPAGICPAAWTCTDIGGSLPVGQDQLTSASTWNETGGGGDIWSNTDSFHFVSQNLSADGTATAHVVSQQATDPWAKAGPMMRATADPGSPYYAVLVTPSHGISVQWRTTQGGTSSQVLAPGSAPAYLMIGRYTSTSGGSQTYYTGYTSSDGTTWTAIPGSTVPVNMIGSLLAGFAITSHNQGVASAVVLDSVAVTGAAVPPPGICPAAWTCADVGTPIVPGSQTLSGTAWTVQGGGGDIWATADAFRFAWQPLAANGTVSARVNSQMNTSAWAKSGVMIRASADPGAPYYAAYITPTNGIVVQSRDAAGNSAIQEQSIPGVPPVYLQVSRSGTTFTAATSSDGNTWTTVSGSGVTLANVGGSALAGLAVTSHDSGQLSTAVFDSVAVRPAP